MVPAAAQLIDSETVADADINGEALVEGGSVEFDECEGDDGDSDDVGESLEQSCVWCRSWLP